MVILLLPVGSMYGKFTYIYYENPLGIRSLVESPPGTGRHLEAAGRRFQSEASKDMASWAQAALHIHFW